MADQVQGGASGDAVILDGDDVSVRPIERAACECGEPATHAVWIDLRAIGVTSIVVEGCKTCMDDCAARARESMR